MVRKKLTKFTETKTPTIQDFIDTLSYKFHSRLPLVTEAQHFNLEQKTLNRRLKRRLSQGIIDFHSDD